VWALEGESEIRLTPKVEHADRSGERMEARLERRCDERGSRAVSGVGRVLLRRAAHIRLCGG